MGSSAGPHGQPFWVECMWLELRRSQPGCGSFEALTAIGCGGVGGGEADGTE